MKENNIVEEKIYDNYRIIMIRKIKIKNIMKKKYIYYLNIKKQYIY